MSNPTNEQELREQVLTEFKQVHKLAPADYTENCTNVVMSIIRTEKLKLLEEVKSSLTQMKELKENRDDKGALWGSYDVVDLDDIREALTKLEAEL